MFGRARPDRDGHVRGALPDDLGEVARDAREAGVVVVVVPGLVHPGLHRVPDDRGVVGGLGAGVEVLAVGAVRLGVPELALVGPRLAGGQQRRVPRQQAGAVLGAGLVVAGQGGVGDGVGAGRGRDDGQSRRDHEVFDHEIKS